MLTTSGLDIVISSTYLIINNNLNMTLIEIMEKKKKNCPCGRLAHVWKPYSNKTRQIKMLFHISDKSKRTFLNLDTRVLHRYCNHTYICCDPRPNSFVILVKDFVNNKH